MTPPRPAPEGRVPDGPDATAPDAEATRELRMPEFEVSSRSNDDALRAAPTSGGPATPGAGGILGTGGPRDLAPGDRISRYRLVERLGEGGFGTVWLAEQLEPVRRSVAIKIVKLGMDTRAVIARFEAERQVLALMDHPGIAHVLDAGATDSGRPFFAMELVRGRPVTEWCDEHRLPLRRRLELFLEVCHAVQHAHGKGIIHRDLKPSNVLVTEQDDRPVPKVIDFGIAKAMHGPAQGRTMHTEQRMPLGTPLYMSPEQAAGGGIDVDTRADVYALGTMLYELLAGVTPLDASRLANTSIAELQRIIRDEEAPPPSARLASSAQRERIAARRGTDARRVVEALRGDLDWIVAKAIDKDRTQRYETVAALADDVSRHLSEHPVVAGPPTAAYRLRKFVRRNRGAVLAAAGLSAAVLLGLAGTSAGLAWALRERARVVAEAGRTAAVAIAADEARREAETQARAADAAAARARAAEADATRRSAELERVAAFQAAMVARIDPSVMGTGIRDDLLAETRSAMLRAGEPDAQVAADVEALGEILENANFTNVAQASLQRNLLARTLETVDAEFGDQPRVRAALLQTAADTLVALGRAEEALPPQEEALRLRRSLLGDADRETLDSVASTGTLLRELGRIDEAEPYYREALDGRRAAFGEDDPDTLESINGMGVLLEARGRLDEAETLWRTALDGFRERFGDDDRRTLSALRNMGVVLAKQKRSGPAETTLREALAGCRRALGDDDPDTLDAVANLGGFYQSQRRFDDAEPLAREALVRSRRLRGDEHPDTLLRAHNLAVVLADQGRLDEAETLYREALDGQRRVLGRVHPQTLRTLTNLAGLLQNRGRLEEAAIVYDEAVVASRRLRGNADVETVRLSALLAKVLVQLGRADDAEPHARRAWEARRDALPESDWRRWNAASMHGEVLAARAADRLERDPVAARTLLDEAEPLLEASSAWFLEHWPRPVGDGLDRAVESIERLVRALQLRVRLDPSAAPSLERWRAVLDERRSDS